MALSVRIVREFFPEARLAEVAACSGFTSFLPGTGPGSGGFSARTFFGVSNSSTGAAGSASFGFSSVGSGEDSINGFTRLAKFRREQERNSQSTAKTTPHEALGQAEPIGPA